MNIKIVLSRFIALSLLVLSGTAIFFAATDLYQYFTGVKVASDDLWKSPGAAVMMIVFGLTLIVRSLQWWKRA